MTCSMFDALLFIYFLKVVPSAPAASDAETDYSDPFDARPDPGAGRHWELKSPLTDCCSYMEPFEAQRIISGLIQIFLSNGKVLLLVLVCVCY